MESQLSPQEQEPKPVPEPSHQFGVHKKQLLIAAVILLILAVLVGWQFWQQQNESQFRVGEYGSLGASGKMLLTLKTKGENYIPGIYSYTIQKGAGPRLLLNDNQHINLGGSFSGSGAFVYYTALSVASGLSNLSVLDLDPPNFEEELLVEELVPGEIIPKIQPQASPDNTKVAYVVFRGGGSVRGAANLVSSWDVYVHNIASGTDTLIGVGAYPQWTPEGDGLVVLHPQGLYHYNLKTGEGALLYPTDGGEARMSSKIDVSRRGNFIAWAAPQSGGVLILKVNSWSPVSVESHRLVKTIATWPTFSPDERFMVVLEATQDENGTITSSDALALAIYNIETLEHARMLDLTQYDPTFSMINDWVQ